MTRRVAVRRQRVFLGEPSGRTVAAMLQIQLAHSTDTPELERLAALDSADPLTGEILLGRVDGRLRAALSLSDGRVVADPFSRSAGVVKLLRAWTS